METVRIRLYYDFASTLCYVVHRILSEAGPQLEKLGVELEWRPIDLTESVPWDRGDSFADNVRNAVRDTARSLGIHVEMPDPWLDSRPASEIALQITHPTSEGNWRKSVFSAIFEHGEHQLTPQLEALAVDLIDGPSSADPASSDPRYALVEESTREAGALGVVGVPTMLLDDWLIGGVYDGDSMLSIFEQLADQYRAQGTSTVN